MTSATKRSRRVILFGPGLDEAGGMAKRARLLAEGLSRRGREVRVLSRKGRGRFPVLRRGKGVIAVEAPGFGISRLGAALYLLIAIPVGVLWARPGTSLLSIHLSSPSTAAGIIAMLRRRPFFAMTTSSGALSEVGLVRSGASARLRRLLLRRSNSFIAQTRFAAQELAECFPDVPCVVLPTPVEIPSRPAPLSGDRRVLFVGRLSKEKDLFGLLTAWSEILSELPEARLSIVGSGGDYRSVERELRRVVAATPMLAESVSMHGWVRDIVGHLRTADVFVHPSLTEGMSNSLLEACAYGRVVVASAIPSNIEVLGNQYPLLFAPGDRVGLEHALRVALCDDGVRSIARRMALEAAGRSSLESVLDRLESALRDASHRSRRKHP